MISKAFFDFIVCVNHVSHVFTVVVDSEVCVFKPFFYLFSHFVMAFTVTVDTDCNCI